MARSASLGKCFSLHVHKSRGSPDCFIQDFLETSIVLLIVLARGAPNADASCYSVYNLAPLGEFSPRRTLKSGVPTHDFLQRSENVTIEKKTDHFVSDRFQ